MEGEGEIKGKRVTLLRFKGKRMRGCKKWMKRLGGRVKGVVHPKMRLHLLILMLLPILYHFFLQWITKKEEILKNVHKAYCD